MHYAVLVWHSFNFFLFCPSYHSFYLSRQPNSPRLAIPSFFGLSGWGLEKSIQFNSWRCTMYMTLCMMLCMGLCMALYMALCKAMGWRCAWRCTMYTCHYAWCCAWHRAWYCTVHGIVQYRRWAWFVQLHDVMVTGPCDQLSLVEKIFFKSNDRNCSQ